MERTNNIAKTLLLILLTVFEGSAAQSQSRPLKRGKMVVNGTTYNVSIEREYKSIYIHNRSADSITRPLIDPNSDATRIPEHFIDINTSKLLEIKRKFYPSTFSRVRVTTILTKDNKLIGMEYALPKSPAITEHRFRSFDAEIRKYLKISIVFPHEWVKNQKYDGYTTKTVLLY